MGNFFFEYGLFTIKSITIILAIVFSLVFIITVISRQKHKESIEIEKINDRFEDLRDTLEAEILSKEEQKILIKQRKKQEKLEQKEEKKRLKEMQNKAPQDNKTNKKENSNTADPKLYIINFDGDVNAAEVDLIRECISAILQVATSKDEVLVVLDSCGGMVHSYGLGSSQLKRIKERGIKLTVAVDLVAASGGYMMASVADKIIAAPFAVIGSIGVLAQLPNFNKLLTKHDVDIEQHTAGEYKTTLTMLGKITDKARKKFKEELEDTHVLFKAFVKQNRPQIDIDKIATGEHWYGTQAIDLKLVDELKTSDDYILEACKEKDVFEVTYKIHETLKDKISSMLETSISKAATKIWQQLNTKYFT